MNFLILKNILLKINLSYFFFYKIINKMLEVFKSRFDFGIYICYL